MENSEKVAVTWVELIFLVLFVLSGMGIWVFTEQQVDMWLKPQEPREEYFQQQANVPIRQAELAIAQDELAAIQAKLIEQQLTLDEQTFKVDSMIAIYPELLEVSPASTDTLSIPAEVVQAYFEAQIDHQTTQKLLAALTADLPERVKTTADRSLALTEAQQSTKREFDLAQERFGWRKRWTTLAWAGVGIAVFLLAAFGLISAVGHGQQFKINRAVVFGGAILLLSVLLGFQAFEMMGAALIGTLILILLLIFISRQAHPASVRE